VQYQYCWSDGMTSDPPATKEDTSYIRVRVDCGDIDIPLERLVEEIRQINGCVGPLGVSCGLSNCGTGVELPGNEVDHRDVVTVGAVPASASLGGLDE
jgi:hypothetical protein